MILNKDIKIAKAEVSNYEYPIVWFIRPDKGWNITTDLTTVRLIEFD